MKEKNKVFLACYIGYVTQSVINNIAPLLFVVFISKYGLSFAQMTELILLNFGTQLLVDLLSIKFVKKIGYRKSAIIAHIFAFLGLFFMTVAPRFTSFFAGLLIACILYAIGGGLLEVIITPIASSNGEDSGTYINLLQSSYCWGSVIVVLISFFYLHFWGTSFWQGLVLILSLIPISNGILFYTLPINEIVDNERTDGILDLVKSPLFWCLLVMIVSSGASEHAISQWTAVFMANILGFSEKAADMVALCFFYSSMGVMRTVYGKYGAKTDLLKTMLLCAGIATISYGLLSILRSPIILMICFGVCGLAIGIMWPGVFTISPKCIPEKTVALFALLSFGGDFGSGIGPATIGFMNIWGQEMGEMSMTMGIIFPLVFLICCVIIMRWEKKDV